MYSSISSKVITRRFGRAGTISAASSSSGAGSSPEWASSQYPSSSKPPATWTSQTRSSGSCETYSRAGCRPFRSFT
jgi:hypothetical protein